MRLMLSPDTLFFRRQSQQTALIRSQLETAGTEAVTGRRVDILSATNGQIGDAFLLSKSIRDNMRAQNLAGLARGRLDTASSAIANIQDAVGSLSTKGLIVLENNSPSAMAAFLEEVGGALETVVGQLNIRLGPRALFAGSASNITPLAPSADILDAVSSRVQTTQTAAEAQAAITNFFNDPVGGFGQFYNGGDRDGPSLFIDAETSLNPIPRADASKFRHLLQGLTTVMAGSQISDSDERKTLLQSGLDMIGGASQTVLTLQAKMGAQSESLEKATNRLAIESNLLSEVENRIMGRDTFEAAAELRSLETQLQTSFTVTGRLTGLGLVNFLR